MSLLDIAVDLFKTKLGASGEGLDMSVVGSALSQLLAGENGELDIASLVEKFQGGGLATLASSWLGDGANGAISAHDILNLFGSDQLGQFSETLGLDQNTAVEGLAGMIPELIDQQSSGGDLLGAAASSVLGKFF